MYGKYSNRSQNAGYEKKDPNVHRQKCFGCGRAWPHPGGKTKCPAWGKDCRKCHKRNHFANVCKSKSSANQVKVGYDDESSESTSSSESYGYSLNASQTLKANDRLEINKN